MRSLRLKVLTNSRHSSLGAKKSGSFGLSVIFGITKLSFVIMDNIFYNDINWLMLSPYGHDPISISFVVICIALPTFFTPRWWLVFFSSLSIRFSVYSQML